jgi:hypothetical protein
MLPLRYSCGCNSREHEFLDLREFLRGIELRCDVQENSLVYLKKKTLLHGQYPELKLIHNTGPLPGLKSTTVWGKSKGRSSVSVTQAAVCDRSAA